MFAPKVTNSFIKNIENFIINLGPYTSEDKLNYWLIRYYKQTQEQIIQRVKFITGLKTKLTSASVKQVILLRATSSGLNMWIIRCKV
jgi:hypothetical protein